MPTPLYLLLTSLLIFFYAFPSWSQCTLPNAGSDFIALRDRREDCQKYIPQLENQLDSLNSKVQQRRQFEIDYQKNKSMAEDKDQPSYMRGYLKGQVTNAQEELKRLPTEDELNSQIKQKQSELDSARKVLSDVETQMNAVINIEKPKQSFKTYMSITFAALVALVIIGFFIIAWRDESVRREIFAGQAGIQFVTLFSLVIAIILFGITQILEGKELSALLGGLSGYILGRGSGVNPTERPQGDPNAQNQDAHDGTEQRG
jgi:hypothetical protein